MNLLIFLLLFVILFVTTMMVYSKFKRYKGGGGGRSVNELSIFYEGESLSKRAKRKNIFFSKKVDCNSRLVECNTNLDCAKSCSPISKKFKREKCLDGLCVYANDSKNTPCENGGQITSYFALGRMIIGCICTDEYVGRFCQVPNSLKPLHPDHSKTFALTY